MCVVIPYIRAKRVSVENGQAVVSGDRSELRYVLKELQKSPKSDGSVESNGAVASDPVGLKNVLFQIQTNSNNYP